ncbi:hypothetical protein AB0C06_31965 [Micromonospora inaquosa]|uniref:hypothetical protein n=1 Tax=Micromonospora inaquosa TaxID=2203716 RepID=UPI001ABFB239|nr:hypothetical protein [Micromonospora inaquosa]
MAGRGLDVEGWIAREGALSRVPAAFAGVVDAARARIAEWFDSGRLHSAYIYGSIPRGTAIFGISDLDLLLALRMAWAFCCSVHVPCSASLSGTTSATSPNFPGTGPLPCSPARRTATCHLRSRDGAERAGRMRRAAIAGRAPSPDPGVLRELIDDLGPGSP